MGNDKPSTDSGDWLPIAKNFATLAVHAGYDKENKNLGALIPPITIAANYEIEVKLMDYDDEKTYMYTRLGNPSRQVLEGKLAALDGAKHGICFASGLAAFSAAFSLLNPGDHFITSDVIYGGTLSQIEDSSKKLGVTVDTIDLEDADALKKHLNPKTRMIFLESPANPTLRVFDVKKISSIVHEYNKDILVLMDNSCLTSYFQRLLPLGCDIVHYSLSKFANGHGDLVGGALVTNNDKVMEQVRRNQHVIGAVPSPFDCYLVTRGLKTLPVRMKEIMKTGIKVAEYLQKHPKVEQVFHPGLPTNPYHALAKKQSSGHSGLLALRVKGGAEGALKFLKGLKLFQYAASFGGCESLVQIPIMLTHAEMSVEQREKHGITDNFIRLNVGLESVEDLIDDLEQAFKKTC